VVAAVRHGVASLTASGHRNHSAAKHAFPTAVETPATPELRTQNSPPATALDGERHAVADGAPVTIGDHRNECLRGEPDEGDSDEDEESDERCRIAPAPAAPGSQRSAATP
jgi:hypothetical protein